MRFPRGYCDGHQDFRDIYGFLDAFLPSENSNLNICHINARSVPAHISDITNLLTESRLHVCAVSETFLKPNAMHCNYGVKGYRVFRNDRVDRSGGGVALYVTEGLSTKVVLSSGAGSEIEFLFVEVSTFSKKVLIGVCYNPPPSNNKINSLQDILSDLADNYDHLILLGDFNINLLKSNAEARRFRTLVGSLSLDFLKFNVTCHSPISLEGSWIDQIIVRHVQRVTRYGQYPVSSISEHDMIFLSYFVKLPKLSASIVFRKEISRVDPSTLLRHAAGLHWNEIFLQSNVDSMMEIFDRNMRFLYDSCVPVRRVLESNAAVPWYCETIRRAECNREKAYNLWLRTREAGDRAVFCKLRNRVTTLKRQLKSSYFQRRFSSLQDCPKKFYAAIRNLSSDSSIVEEPVGSPDEFNEFFCCRDRVDVSLDGDGPDCFSFRCIDASELLDALNAVKSTAIGVDGLPRPFYMMVMPVIFPFLLHIMNYSITSSCFPAKWRRSIIRPVPKNSNPKSISDFRPIGILPFLSKVFESVLRDQVVGFFTKMGSLNRFQSGYRLGYGTHTALLDVATNSSRGLDTGCITVKVLLDFSNAFGAVNHHSLLLKLRSSGLTHGACSLILSYLSDRSQIVRYGGRDSIELECGSFGVIQGSLLGPDLFLRFINDLPDVLVHSQYQIYADDTQIYITGKPSELPLIVNRLNEDLRAVVGWAKSNGIRLNASKTKALCISRCPVVVSGLQLDGSEIEVLSEVRNLGVLFDSRLSFESHINSICSKIHYSLSRFNQIKSYLPRECRLRLVRSFILPPLYYCDVLFFNCFASYRERIERAINACTRFVFGLRYYDHLGDVRNVVLGMSLENHFKVRALMFLHKLINTKTPDYLYDNLNFGASARTANLLIPWNRTRHFNNSLFVSGASLWNSLPSHLKTLRSAAAFRSAIRMHFS